MALFDRENLTRSGLPNDIPLVAVQVCWDCQYLQSRLGRYSSQGPKCGECGNYLDTYKVIG